MKVGSEGTATTLFLVAHFSLLADFDFSFILFGAWFQLIGALASAAAEASAPIS
jgi:hypothetical protein